MDTILNMSPIVPYIILIFGFFMLVKGADFFVDGCSAVARKFHIPPIIIGLTIVSCGTSAPEAAVSIASSIKGANDMSVSNVLGSNIFNLLVVVGACALIQSLGVSSDMLKRDFPFILVLTTVLLLMTTDCFTHGFNVASISRLDGIILLTIFILYIVILVRNTLKSKNDTPENNGNSKPVSIPKSLIFMVAGLLAIIFGGDFVVDSASHIALSFGLSNTLVGLTIVAIGTSLPELVTSIVSSCKGENEIALGNVIGSNIFNILFVLGIAATVSPIDLSAITNSIFTLYDMIILLAVTILAYIFALTRKTVSKLEGTTFLLLYIAYMAYIIVR